MPAPREPRLAIFGAGRVGAAVARQFADLPFQVEQFDSRPEMERPGVSVFSEDDLVEIAGSADEGDYVLLFSATHEQDFRLAEAVLKAGKAKYCGMMGSRRKQAEALEHLQAAGLAESQIARLTCPVGIPGLHSQDAAVIAVAIAAQILQIALAEPQD